MALTRTLLQKIRRIHASHRARAGAVRLDYSAEDLTHLVQDALHLPCRYCRRALTVRSLSIDHQVAIAVGGTHTLDNLEVLCLTCNSAKGILSPEEFSTLYAALWTMSSRSRVSVIHRLRIGSFKKPDSGRDPSA